MRAKFNLRPLAACAKSSDAHSGPRDAPAQYPVDVDAMKHSAEVRRMWSGGPLRRWSPTATDLCYMGRSGGSFTGSYVCDGCRMSVDGIYLVRETRQWLCAGCKSTARTQMMKHPA